MNPGFLVGVALLTLLVIGMILDVAQDRKRWNKGFHAGCGKPWTHFDTDSQGGRSYKCDCGCIIWIS